MSASTSLWQRSGISSVDILDCPARKRKILRNFDLLLPKFHFILPKFYFAPRWVIFVFSVDIPEFLGGVGNQQRCMSSYRVALYRFIARI